MNRCRECNGTGRTLEARRILYDRATHVYGFCYCVAGQRARLAETDALLEDQARWKSDEDRAWQLAEEARREAALATEGRDQ